MLCSHVTRYNTSCANIRWANATCANTHTPLRYSTNGYGVTGGGGGGKRQIEGSREFYNKSREGERQTDLLAGSVQQPHRVGGASWTGGGGADHGAGGRRRRRVGAVEPADAVEAEAVGAVVRAVEDGGRRVARDGLARALDPAAVLGALPLERTPAREKRGTNEP